jgi:hypothetical protein
MDLVQPAVKGYTLGSHSCLPERIRPDQWAGPLPG